MKKIGLFLLMTFFIASSCKDTTTQEVELAVNEIHFENISFQNALQKAKNENKNVFVNVYAVWCGPCKMLKQTTFQDENVIKAVNENFVSLDIDAEEGDGIQFAKDFEVTAHPLVLIISPDGKVQKRILGLKKAEPFLHELEGFI